MIRCISAALVIAILSFAATPAAAQVPQTAPPLAPAPVGSEPIVPLKYYCTVYHMDGSRLADYLSDIDDTGFHDFSPFGEVYIECLKKVTFLGKPNSGGFTVYGSGVSYSPTGGWQVYDPEKKIWVPAPWSVNAPK